MLCFFFVSAYVTAAEKGISLGLWAPGRGVEWRRGVTLSAKARRSSVNVALTKKVDTSIPVYHNYNQRLIVLMAIWYV
jgi:hypothetical protein